MWWLDKAGGIISACTLSLRAAAGVMAEFGLSGRRWISFATVQAVSDRESLAATMLFNSLSPRWQMMEEPPGPRAEQKPPRASFITTTCSNGIAMHLYSHHGDSPLPLLSSPLPSCDAPSLKPSREGFRDTPVPLQPRVFSWQFTKRSHIDCCLSSLCSKPGAFATAFHTTGLSSPRCTLFIPFRGCIDGQVPPFLVLTQN